MADDRVAAYLAEARERAEGIAVACEPDCGGEPCTGHDALRLLAAVRRLLKLAGDWDAKAREIGEQITLQDCDGAVAGFKMIGHQNHRDHARALREAISAELLGEEKPS